MISWLLLILGLTLLAGGATWLTNGSVAIAKKMHVSEYLIGMTIVAVGTSLPELMVSGASAIAGNADVALGNVVGSNVFNVFVVLGVCALFSPVPFSRNNIRYDMPLLILVSLLFTAMVCDGGLSRWQGVVLLLGYVAVLIFSYVKNNEPHDDNAPVEPTMPWWRAVAMIVFGLLGLVYGARVTLDSGTDIARQLGVSEAVIAITILAGGTSLPELVTSVVAAMKGHSALALGNVMGSCVANILLILGFCATVVPLQMSDITMVDIAVMNLTALMVLLSAYLLGRGRITRAEGVIYLACYVGYIVYLIG